MIFLTIDMFLRRKWECPYQRYNSYFAGKRKRVGLRAPSGGREAGTPRVLHRRTYTFTLSCARLFYRLILVDIYHRRSLLSFRGRH